jgi:hypothetical protein
MADGLERLRYAWDRADGEARRRFLLEVYRAQAGPGAGEGTIEITSQVNAGDGSPAVLFVWGERRIQVTPAEAIRHALSILEVATDSYAESFLFRFAVDRVGTEPERAAQLLMDFRRWRAEIELPQSSEA